MRKMSNLVCTNEQMEYFVKNISEGLGVPFSLLAENCFKIKLHPYQANAIDCCSEPNYLGYVWSRGEGASFCAIVDACFSFLYLEQKVFVLTPRWEQARLLFDEAKKLLNKSHYPFTTSNGEMMINHIDEPLYCNSDSFICFMVSREKHLMGRKFDKLIFDNCSSFLHYDHALVREYKTF